MTLSLSPSTTLHCRRLSFPLLSFSSSSFHTLFCYAHISIASIVSIIPPAMNLFHTPNRSTTILSSFPQHRRCLPANLKISFSVCPFLWRSSLYYFKFTFPPCTNNFQSLSLLSHLISLSLSIKNVETLCTLRSHNPYVHSWKTTLDGVDFSVDSLSLIFPSISLTTSVP